MSGTSIMVTRRTNGWVYELLEKYQKTDGVKEDGEPLVLRFYADSKWFEMTISEKPR